jgi:hypothetical protein
VSAIETDDKNRYYYIIRMKDPVPGGDGSPGFVKSPKRPDRKRITAAEARRAHGEDSICQPESFRV